MNLEMNKIFYLILLCVFIPCGSVTATNQNGIKNFFIQLSKALSENNVDWLSNNSSYPLRVYKGNKTIYINNEQSFKEKYDEIFPEYIKKAVSCQSADSLLSSWKGTIISRGAIWYTEAPIFNPIVDEFDCLGRNRECVEEAEKLIDKKTYKLRIVRINHGEVIKKYAAKCSN